MKISIQHIRTLTGHIGAVYQLQAVNNGAFISAGGDGWIVRWTIDGESVDTGKLLAKTGTQIFSLLYDEGESLLVAGDMHGEVHFINMDSPDKTRRIQHHKKGVFGIKMYDKSIFTLGGDGILSKWDRTDLSKVESMKLSDKSLRSMTASDTAFYIGASDKSIIMIDRVTEKVISVEKFAHENSIFSLAFDSKVQYLLSGGRDAMLNIWSEGTALKIYKGIPAHLFTINAIQFNPSGKLFATASRDKTIKIWDAESYKLLKVIESIRDNGHVNSVNHLLWLSESILLSCSDDRTIKMWEIKYKV